MLLFSNRKAASAMFFGLFLFITKTTSVLCLRTTGTTTPGSDTKGSVAYSKEFEEGFQQAFTSDLFKKQQHHRKLEDVGATPKRVCNEQIDRVSKETVLIYLRVIYASVLPTVLLQGILNAFESNLLKYDVAVYKVCGSCQDFCSGSGVTTEDEEDMTCNGFCETSAYGYDAQHSALTFFPLEASSSSNTTGTTEDDFMFLQGQLRTVFTFHGFTPDAYQGPTDYHPEDFTAALVTAQSSPDTASVFLANNLATMIALTTASAGAVAIVPDYLGFGETLTTHNRTIVSQSTYQQAAMVSYKSTKALLRKKSNCTTVLQDVMTITGFSEGGFAATTSAAAAMAKAGFRLLTNRLAAPVLASEKLYAFLFKSYNESLISPDKFNALMPIQMAFAGYAGSIDFPGKANTGFQNQTFLSSVWMDPDNSTRNVIDWLAAPDPLTTGEIFPLLPSPNFLELLNPALLKLLETGESDWCREANVEVGVNDKICEAIRDESVYDLLAALSSSTTICSGTGDTIIPETMFPPEIFNDFVQPIQTIFGTTISQDHGLTCFLCQVVYLNSLIGLDNNGLPLNTMPPDDSPYLVLDLEESDLEQCFATKNPVSTPTCAKKNQECSATSECCKGGTKLKCDNDVCIKCAKRKNKCKKNADCCSNRCKKAPSMGKKKKASFICK